MAPSQAAPSYERAVQVIEVILVRIRDIGDICVKTILLGLGARACPCSGILVRTSDVVRLLLHLSRLSSKVPVQRDSRDQGNTETPHVCGKPDSFEDVMRGRRK